MPAQIQIKPLSPKKNTAYREYLIKTPLPKPSLEDHPDIQTLVDQQPHYFSLNAKGETILRIYPKQNLDLK